MAYFKIGTDLQKSRKGETTLYYSASVARKAKTPVWELRVILDTKENKKFLRLSRYGKTALTFLPSDSTEGMFGHYLGTDYERFQALPEFVKSEVRDIATLAYRHAFDSELAA